MSDSRSPTEENKKSPWSQRLLEREAGGGGHQDTAGLIQYPSVQQTRWGRSESGSCRKHFTVQRDLKPDAGPQPSLDG